LVALDTAPTSAARPSHQALYRRWRAQTFAEIVGQAAVVETLRNAVRLERLSHGLLFVGPRGTGKTSMARIVAKAVNCLQPTGGEPDDACEPCAAIREGRALDVVELDAASNNRVDDMRELLPRVYTAPADLRHKVFIIDEVQRIKEGWDVLLKTLEEPPPNVLFIFCTTDPSGIRPAVVSRLQRFTFRPLPAREIEGKLRRILEAEGRRVTDEAVALIAARAAGGMRDAESMLDQVLAAGAETIDADAVRDLLGLAEQQTVDEFVRALVGGDALAGVRLLDDLERDGRDLVAFADQVVAGLRDRLVASLGAGSGAGSTATLAHAARRLAAIDTARGAAGGFRLQLELVLLEAAAPAARLAADGVAPRAETVQAPRAKIAPVPAGEEASPVPPVPAAPGSAEPETTAERSAPPPPRPADAEPAPASSASRELPPLAAASRDAEPAAALSALLAAWPEVVAEIGRNPANRPLISACRPVEVGDAFVVLGFPEDQVFLRDIAERKRAILEDGLAVVLGRRVAVRLVATNVELAAPAAADLPDPAEVVAHARRVFAEDLLDVAEVE
jgi:DNA polymerase III subunit gamma/tau